MSKLYFNFLFTEDLEKEMRKTFEISDETEVRLWYKYMSNTYEHLSKKESTLQDAALYSGQVWHYFDYILIRRRVPGIKGYMHM
jgi:hypothetical protein